MEKGSLVVYLMDGTRKQIEQAKSLGYTLPVVDKVYTVREVQNIEDRIGLLLEEIVNPVINVTIVNGVYISMESGFDAKRFAEILCAERLMEEVRQEQIFN